MNKFNNNGNVVYTKFNKGFTLLEVLIALLIISFLSFGVASSLKITRDFDHYEENEKKLMQVRTALLTFVQINGYLPCPDGDGNGRENRALVTPFNCSFQEGTLPYIDVGVSAVDAWNNPWFYGVNRDADGANIGLNASPAAYFNNQLVTMPGASFPAPFFGVATLPLGADVAGFGDGAGNYQVCSRDETGGCIAGSDVIEAAAIAVVVSFGRNGAQTWESYRNNTVAGFSLTEAENIDRDRNVWQARLSDVAGQTFDDQVVWLSGYDVKYVIFKSNRGLLN